MSEAKIKITAVDAASTVLREVRSNFDRLDAAATKVGTVLGLVGVAGVSGLVALARNAINGVDALNDLADATGASIENLSALEDVAARTGTEFGTVSSALVKFNQVLKDSKPGSGAEQALQAIGLTSKELRAIDPAQALLEVSKALDGFADNGDKARIVQELFGKSTKDVAALLKDLAEKGALVPTVFTEQAKAAEEFNKQIFQLQKNATDAGRALTTDLVAGINAAAKAYKEGGFFEGLRTLLTGSDEFKNNKALVQQTEELITLENDVLRLRSTGIALDAAQARKKEERIKVLREEIKTTQSYRKLLSEGLGASAPTGKPSVIAPDPEADKKRQDAAKAAIDATNRAQEERIRLERRLREEQERQSEREAEAISRLIEAQDRKSESYIEGLIKENASLDESIEKQRQQVEAIGLTKDQLDALTLARIDQTIAVNEATLAIGSANAMSAQEIAALERKIELLKQQRELTAQGQLRQAQADTKEDQDKASKQYADTLRNDLKGAFSAAFRDSENPLQAFGDALQNVVMSRLSTALAESLFNSAAGFFNQGSGGNEASTLARLFGSFEGGGYTGQGARTGGMDGRGGFLAMVHPNETVIDHTRGQSASQPVTVIQNFTVGDVASVSMVRQAVAGSEQRIAGAMRRSMVYGGALA
jgi:hypothetical protein